MDSEPLKPAMALPPASTAPLAIPHAEPEDAPAERAIVSLPWPHKISSLFRQSLVAVLVVTATTLLGFVWQPLINLHGIAMLYLLAVVVLGAFVGRGPTFLAATLSALLWNYFFIEPLHTFRISHFDDLMLFGMYFVVALVLGQLTARIRAQENTQRVGQERALVLYTLTRELSETSDFDRMLEKVAQRLGSLFDAEAAVFLPGAAGKPQRQPHPAGTFAVPDSDQPAIQSVFERGEPAGRFCARFRSAEAFYAPLASGGRIVGVLGLRLRQTTPPTPHQRNLLDACSKQIAMAFDQHRLRELSEKARLLAESERLSKTLLNSMSHEIRTPIAVIKNAAGHLADFQQDDATSDQRAMIAEINEATDRLDRLVGKVLDITRLETGRVIPRLTPCDIRDLVHLSVKETRRELAAHKVSVELPPDLPLVTMDYVLMQQALQNLLSNAAIHSPPGTEVKVCAALDSGALLLTVADRGPGIPADSLPRVFDKFYRGPNAPTGGTGLGLSLVRGFVEAHGGQVTAENRLGGGAIFTIRLPLSPTPATLNCQSKDHL